MWVAVQYVTLLSDCLVAIYFMSFGLCYSLINYFIFYIYSFYVHFLVL